MNWKQVVVGSILFFGPIVGWLAFFIWLGIWPLILSFIVDAYALGWCMGNVANQNSRNRRLSDANDAMAENLEKIKKLAETKDLDT